MASSIAESTDLMQASSLYLDSQVSHQALEREDSILPPPPSTVSIPSVKPTPPNKSRKALREEKAKRLAAEQAEWVRQKFDLPSEELLIASFSAALLRHILLQGRIHITTTAICFYAKIFGRITKEAFPFASLARVKKRKGGFIANAIKIYFIDDTISPVIIGSLNHRERAFRMIQARLKEVNPDAAEDANDSGSVPSAPNSCVESEDRSFEDDESPPLGISTNIISAPSAFSNASNGRLDAVLYKSGFPKRDDNGSIGGSDCSNALSHTHSDTEPRNAHFSSRNQISPLIWQSHLDKIDCVYGSAYEKRTERARGVLRAPVREVFNLLFIGDWLKHYHETSCNREVTISEWSRGEEGFMVREVHFKKPLRYKIGPKETRVKETQRYSFTSKGGVIIELEGQNLDAPYGDYFVCESYFELTPEDDGLSTLLVASFAVHFSKGTILKGKIESGALAETNVAYQRLLDLASKRIEDYANEKSRRGGRRANAQKRSQDSILNDVAPPMSPSKKQRSGDMSHAAELAARVQMRKRLDLSSIPESKEKGEAVSKPSEEIVTLEMQDSSVTVLRVVAIGMLLMVCVLLFAVLILLFKMRREIGLLEELVAKSTLARDGQCLKESCVGK